MKFSEQLNIFIDNIGCSAKALSDMSGLSPATLSRYRSGERVPETNSEAFSALVKAISSLSNSEALNEESITDAFLKCSDITLVDKEQLRKNFNTLLNILDINIARFCRYTNYDSSTIFRFRNGSRKPSDPTLFASSVAGFVSSEMDSPHNIAVMAKLFDCDEKELSEQSARFSRIQNWLLTGKGEKTDSILEFFEKLNSFDLNEYIKAIHFDEMKVPSLPFILPTSKKYRGLKEMMESELDFLKATVLSKSTAPVIMYSDMPMSEMAKDKDFAKKWMFGMALMLKKRLHLHQIHNLDRSFEDMMLGLESWIPMYMTGQISPYYLKNVQNNVFLHLLKVSGAAALSGEAIAGFHENGEYYLTKQKEEVGYYNKRATELLKSAQPLMEIYREEQSAALNAFLAADAEIPQKRRNTLSSLPIYTIGQSTLEEMLKAHGVSPETVPGILKYAASQRAITEEMLKISTVEDEIPALSEAEFSENPMTLSLSGMFYEKDIPYTYEEYLTHLSQTEEFKKCHETYSFRHTSQMTFKNLRVIIHEGSWVMISKNKSPAIHFVIHHPKLRSAIENFIPPMVEDDEDE